MKFDRKIWLNWKSKKPCPSCENGQLIMPSKDGKIINETAESLELNSYGGHYYSDYVFSAHLKCSNCKETVVACGTMSEENYPSNESIGIQNDFYPLFFHPAPNIISIPKSCPESVKVVLKESFSLYWLDVSSCANKVRIAIEVLLNELKVVKTMRTKKGRRYLNLHERILEFEKKNKIVGNFLLSIKWIGNAGSHFSSVTKENVLDAYELIEYSIEQLYDDRKKKLMKISKEINKKKKPL